MRHSALLALPLAGLLLGGAALDDPMLRKLERVEPSVSLAGGDLRLVNVYKTQVRLLHDRAGRSEGEVLDRFVREVYQPNLEVWSSYVGTENDFREVVRLSLLDPATQPKIRSRTERLLELDLSSIFEEAVARTVALTGRRPRGTWYALFGHGMADMGGVGGGVMLMDFSHQIPEAKEVAFLLPHELNHQIYDQHTGDPDAGTVLHRVLNEGFASWFNDFYWAGRYTPAQSLMYHPEQWTWCLEHEAEIFAAAQPLLFSRELKDANTLVMRGKKLLDGAPGAAGYFLGYRIVQAYVDRHGPDSWKQIYDLPVREVLARSGYAPGKAGQP
jgi:hypothetical protein